MQINAGCCTLYEFRINCKLMTTELFWNMVISQLATRPHFPVGTRYFSFLWNVPDRFWGLPSGYPGYFPGVKNPRRDYNYTPPSRAVFKNEWSVTSPHCIRLHCVDRGNLTFTFLFRWSGCIHVQGGRMWCGMEGGPVQSLVAGDHFKSRRVSEENRIP